MNLSLQRLIAVAQARSLREASDLLNLTPSAVSMHVSQLEEELGRKLFQRDGRGMTLTPTGEELLRAIGDSVEELEAAVRRVRDGNDLDSRHLRITALSTMATYLVPSAVARLHSTHPKLRLTVNVNTSVEVVELVERGKADIGIVYDIAVDTSDVEITPLYNERIAAFARSGAFDLPSDIGIEDLIRFPLLLPPNPLALRRIIERECNQTLRPTVECNTSDMVLRLANLGVGVGLLPDAMPHEMVEACGMQRYTLLNGRVRRGVVAITRLCQARSPAVEAALRILAQLP